MKCRFLTSTAVVLMLISACSETQIRQDVILWYDQPATDWYEALPIGNGTLGAMIFGGIQTEQLQLNENTLYSDEPGQRNVKIDFTEKLEQVKDLLKEGKLDEVNNIVSNEWIGRAQPCYQPFGNLY